VTTVPVDTALARGYEALTVGKWSEARAAFEEAVDTAESPEALDELGRSLASNGGGELYVDRLKNKRARTVPLVPVVVPIVDRWSAGKSPGEWLFAAPAGGPLRETNWQRSVSWREAKATIGRPELRVHDLRHTAASVWLASGADPKVVQRVLGHATAAMTMDLYGHMIDRNLWDAAQRLGGTTGARPEEGPDDEGGALAESRR
jgi:integrase